MPIGRVRPATGVITAVIGPPGFVLNARELASGIDDLIDEADAVPACHAATGSRTWAGSGGGITRPLGSRRSISVYDRVVVGSDGKPTLASPDG